MVVMCNDYKTAYKIQAKRVHGEELSVVAVLKELKMYSWEFKCFKQITAGNDDESKGYCSVL